MYVHLAARCRTFLFNDPTLALYAWCALRAAFPTAIAVCIMGNHFHIVVWVPDPVEAAHKLSHTLAGITRVAKIERGYWDRVKPAHVIEGVEKLRALVRYVVLNPCRADLTRDPLVWPWTTHRDVMGGIVDPWVDAHRLAIALQQPRENFEVNHHAYVSNDAKAVIGGTPVPTPAVSTRFARWPLVRIATAACAATRSPLSELRTRSLARRTFVLLAYDQGWSLSQLVGDLCDVSDEAIRRLIKDKDESLLSPARMTLGDDRLIRWPC